MSRFFFRKLNSFSDLGEGMQAYCRDSAYPESYDIEEIGEHEFANLLIGCIRVRNGTIAAYLFNKDGAVDYDNRVYFRHVHTPDGYLCDEQRGYLEVAYLCLMMVYKNRKDKVC